MARSDVLGKLGNVPLGWVWFALLSAPGMLFVQINLGLAAQPGACAGTRAPLYLVDAAALVVGAASLAASFWLRGQAGRDGAEVPFGVLRSLARFGVYHNALIVLVIVLAAVSHLFLDPCRLH